VSRAARTIVLDNEAVQAVADIQHPKHRDVVAMLDATRRRRRDRVTVVVPVAVRIEAGCDRSAPAAAMFNRISGARDIVLDGASANRASVLRAQVGVSVVDATVAEVAERFPGPVAILTSDGDDMERLCPVLDNDVRVIRL